MSIFYRIITILLFASLTVTTAAADEILVEQYESELSELLNLIANEQDPKPKEKLCCKLTCQKGGGFGATVLKSYWAKSKDQDECRGVNGDPCGATNGITGRYETGVYSSSWIRCP